jgi:hypothetical protein
MEFFKLPALLKASAAFVLGKGIPDSYIFFLAFLVLQGRF